MNGITMDQWLKMVPDSVVNLPEGLRNLLFQLYQTFIAADRWKWFLNGLKITFAVTIGALILGVIIGLLIGGMLPFLFSAFTMQSVGKAAFEMIEEVRRQFRDIPGILEGKAKPDYKTCIEISSQGALKEMRMPAIISIIFPVIAGFLFGPYFVGGLLIGATLSAIMLAIFTGNAGGAWDNGKKYIESGAIEGQGKGSPAHDAAVVGDTVGDPLKDTVGPSLDILIKIMSTVSLVAAVMFYNYNLLYLIFGIK